MIWQTLQNTTEESEKIGIPSQIWELGHCVRVTPRVNSGQDAPFAAWASAGHRGNSHSQAIHQTPPRKQAPPERTNAHAYVHAGPSALPTNTLNCCVCRRCWLRATACTPLIPPIYKRVPKYTQRLIKVGHLLLKRIPVLWDEKVISPSTP